LGEKVFAKFFLVKNVNGSRFGKWAENLVYFVAFFGKKNLVLNFHFFSERPVVVGTVVEHSFATLKTVV
jgi:hypothetical protein